MNWYLSSLAHYADFSGRARRQEFWMFSLINFCIVVGIILIQLLLRTNALFMLYTLFIFIPSIALTTRRLHDIGRSGWWQLVALIPVLGSLVLLVFCCIESNANDNQYGPSPKAGDVSIEMNQSAQITNSAS